MTTIYLAYSGAGVATLEKHSDEAPVNLLVSLVELRSFEKHRSKINVGRWCLDSGAFSVRHSDKTITNAEYIAAARSVDACEMFGLDVIYDAEGTKRNLEEAWAAGVPAIPTFHYGSPPDALRWCADNSEKIALGGIARIGDKRRKTWADQVFARVWPKKIHGFACASEKGVLAFPWHSVDASSWCYAPMKMGHYAGFTGKQIHLRKAKTDDVWGEVVEHQRRERLAAHRWRNQLAQLEKAA